MNDDVQKVMRACNNYFAVLCERVKDAETVAKTVKASFEGKYTPGMIVRVHGAYTGGYGDFGEGELYTVEAFDGETLTLDKPVHTFAPDLFIAVCEPPNDFISLCNEIAEWEAKAASRAGLASESIDGYSYSVASDQNGRTGFEAAFSGRLAPFRCPKATQLYYARNAAPWSVI